MARVLIPLADGVEEMEAVIIIDVLRRAGWSVTSAAVGASRRVHASRGVVIEADAEWDAVRPDAFDAILIPGGMGGTRCLAGHDGVKDAVRTHRRQGNLVGAICAGPLVLQAAGILDGRRATCHPAVRDELTAPLAVTDDPVVCDGLLLTSQGPGTAFDFALAAIEALDGHAAAATVRAGLVLPPRPAGSELS